jgi:hypothetical protein
MSAVRRIRSASEGGRGLNFEMTAPSPRPNRLWRHPATIFIVATTLRALAATSLGTMNWGQNEMAEIARQLIVHRQYISAFHDYSGPTAWFPPGYAAILVPIFLLFGIKSHLSAVVATGLNVLLGSVTALAILKIGRKYADDGTGVIAAWMWAVLPPIVVMPVFLWESSLSALLLSCAMLQTMGVANGVVWGIAALVNPALLAPLPAIAFLSRREWKRVLTTLAACAAVMLPWTIRNAVCLHLLVPVRSNFWPELYFGNVSFDLHPHAGSMLYQREGETRFVEEMRGRAINYVHNNKAEFLSHTAQRVADFWTGPPFFKPLPLILFILSVLGCALGGRKELGAVLVFFPVVYYVTFTFSRYRHPIEPVMCTLSVVAVTEAYKHMKEFRRRSPHTP